MKRIFASYGASKRIENDNRPPFGLKDFQEFTLQERFEHHKIKPLHPRANGEVGQFMQMLNKTEQITHLQGKDHLERQNTTC